MSTNSLYDLTNSAHALDENRWSYTITEDWMQGRTSYGGLSAALCLDACYRVIPDLPPLRSAQVTFIGPVSHQVDVTVTTLRRGRSVASIHARMMSEAGVGTEVVFTFGAARPSKLNATYTAHPDVPTADATTNFFSKTKGPVFTQHFDCRLARGAWPVSGSDEDEMLLWVRYAQEEQNTLTEISPYVSLLALADMPPPAVLPKLTEFAPLSSMTWMVNFLAEPITSENGWWLLRSAAENAAQGYSSQDMQVWNESGELVVSGRQSVAIFY